MSDDFERIAQEAIQEAEQVKCSLSDFRDGLKTMVEALRLRLEQVNDELAEDEESG